MKIVYLVLIFLLAMGFVSGFVKYLHKYEVKVGQCFETLYNPEIYKVSMISEDDSEVRMSTLDGKTSITISVFLLKRNSHRVECP